VNQGHVESRSVIAVTEKSKSLDDIALIENFLRLAEERAIYLACECGDVRIKKILELISMPNIQAARAAIRVAKSVASESLPRPLFPAGDNDDGNENKQD
jgi:hypothetical protein